MRFGRYIASAALACGLIACGAAQAEPTRPAAPVDPTADAARYAWDRDVNRLTFTVAANANREKAWYEWAAAVEAQRAAEAQAAAARAQAERVISQAHGAPKPPSGAQGGAPAPSSVGGACGGATNGADRYIQRESRGNPNARNSSGAWGCYQIMPGTWQSSCSDLGPHGSASTDAQAQCASRLPQSAWSSSGPTG